MNYIEPGDKGTEGWFFKNGRYYKKREEPLFPKLVKKESESDLEFTVRTFHRVNSLRLYEMVHGRQPNDFDKEFECMGMYMNGKP